MFLTLEKDAELVMKTSLDKTGSDGMNVGPDYSSAYCVVTTDTDFVGHGMVRDCLVIWFFKRLY